MLTNLKNNVKLGGYYRLTDKVSVGGGIIYNMQDEFRTTIFRNTGGFTLTIDTTLMKLKEYAAFISPVYKVNSNFSVGLSAKSIWQDFNIPNTVFVNSINVIGIGTFTDSSIKKQRFDVDVSATYKVNGSFQVGFNAMNLAGTQLHADAFVPGQANPPLQNQRSFGLVLCYKWQRLNVGADILFTQDDFYDVALGVNYVPFNNALISAGMTVKQLSYSFAFRIKNFRIAYINDNDRMVNEKGKGKYDVLNGKIYGGFIFDLN